MRKAVTERGTARAVPAASAAVPTVVYPTAFEDVGLQAATAAGSTPVDSVREGGAGRGRTRSVPVGFRAGSEWFRSGRQKWFRSG